MQIKITKAIQISKTTHNEELHIYIYIYIYIYTHTYKTKEPKTIQTKLANKSKHNNNEITSKNTINKPSIKQKNKQKHKQQK